MKPYKDFALNLAQKADAILKEGFQGSLQKKLKEDGSLVTHIDFAVNKLVLDEVRKEYPDHSILAEEESDMRKLSEYTWVCDPLDGTFPFSHGIPTFGFSLALVRDGFPVLGVATVPMQDKIFFAEKGKGTYLNGVRLMVPKNNNLEGSLTTVGIFRHSTYHLLHVTERLVEQGAYVFNFGSIVYAGLLVASGEAVSATFSGNTAHDVAALKIIIEESGGRVTDLYGNDQRYDGIVKGALISNGAVHEELLKLIAEKEIARN